MIRQLHISTTIKLIFCLCLFVSSKVIAQQTRTLDSVTISSKKRFSNLSSSLPVQTLSDSTLKGLNGLSVADAIRYFAGVQLKDYGGVGGLKTVDIRNMGSQHTGFLYDGVPLGNMQNGQVDLGKFSLDNLQEISLFNAGPTFMLQSASAYASGATIYVTSRKPVFDSSDKTHGIVTFRTGSFGLYNPSILLQQKLNNHYALQLNVERVGANGQYKFVEKVKDAYDTTAIRKNADIHSWRSELALFGKFKDSSYWQTQLYYYSSERGLPGAIVNNKFLNSQRLWDRNFFFQSKYTRPVSLHYNLSFIGKYAYDYTHYQDPTIVSDEGIINNYYRTNELFLSMANEFIFSKKWKSEFSIDYRYNHLNANLNNFAYPTRNSILAVIASQYQTDRLTFQGNLLVSYISDKVEYGENGGNRKEYTPTLNFSWKPFANSNFRARGFYKDIFRMPTFNDLYYNILGIKTIRPEFVKQYDIGFTDWKSIDNNGSFLSYQVDAFHNIIRDKIIALPSNNLFIYKIINIPKVISNGISAIIKSENHWNNQFYTIVNLQYTYENTKNKSAGNAYGFPVPYTPLHSGSAIINSHYKTWEINYSYIYTGSRYNITDITLPSSKIASWYTHDLNFVKKIYYKKYSIKLLLEVNNVLNQQYEVILNYPMPGRNYRFGIIVTI